VFDRRINELLELCETDNLLKLARNLPLGHPQNSAAEKCVLAACELWMKSCSDFKESTDPPVDFSPSLGRPGDARQKLQKRGLAGTVAANESEDFTFLDLE
jgi:hypothetical protein